MERVMQSLERCRLVENRNVGLTICGRTDKGVSAVGQVLSVVLRSAVNCGVGVISDSGPNIDQRPEIDYVLLLNRVLPHDIRVLAWSPVSEDFNARFTCLQRSYSYYFPLSGLDLSAMQDAASRLEGTHDFRNFCSNQVESDCVTFVRRIDRVAVEMLGADSSLATTLCSVSVSASGFLYHQIRYMMSVLIRIGRGYETPALIDEMLDIEKTPAKPQYYMAADFPLLLTGAQYPDGAVKWQTSEAAGLNLIKHFQTLWADHTIRAATVKTMLDHVERCFPHYPPLLHYLDRIIPEGRWRDCSGSPYKGPFKPMMKRSVELSVEEKLDRFKRKKEKSEAGDSLNQENLNRDTDT
ncbi:unnamed protein product [Dicrocoelium dendriticum]|nr:unnamed protein product [Dicrocoelium dendriticum]